MAAQNVAWRNVHGRRGIWTAIVDGQHLTIYWVDTLKGPMYRRTTSYNSEMWHHQFYTSLREAKADSVRMLREHLAAVRARPLFRGTKESAK